MKFHRKLQDIISNTKHKQTHVQKLPLQDNPHSTILVPYHEQEMVQEALL